MAMIAIGGAIGTGLFMGSKFAIFNYATRSVGGYVDVDSFDYSFCDASM